MIRKRSKGILFLIGVVLLLLNVQPVTAQEEGAEVFVQLGHNGSVESVAFSPDDRHALSGSRDGELKLWEVSSGREIRTFTGHSRGVNSVAFSPDGQYMLSGGPRKIKLWEVSTGSEVRTIHTRGVMSVAFSPDGRYVLSGSRDGELKLWEVSTGREIRTFTGHSMDVNSVAFSPDGQYALSGSGDPGSRDGELKLWEVSTGREVRTFTGHSKVVNSVAFSPDGQHVLSSTTKKMKLWEVSTGRAVRTIHASGVMSVAFSPDGRYVLAGNWDKELKLWEVSSGHEIRTFTGHSDWINSVAFSPNGQYALSGSSDKTMKLWEVSTGREMRTFAGSGYTSRVTSLKLSPDGRYALSGSSDGNMKLWEVFRGREIRSFTGHSDLVWSIAFSPDGRYVLSGSWDGKLKLWEVSTGREVRSFTGLSSTIHGVAFSPDGQYALAGNRDGELKLWEVSTGREIRSFTGHSDRIWSVAFSPDGQYVSSRSHDGTLKLWEVSTGREIRSFSGLGIGSTSVVFSPDGQYVLSGSWDGKLKLWEVSTGREVRTIHASGVKSVAFSPDGQYALSGSKTMKLWEVSTGREVKSFIGHSKVVNSVGFSPDGQYVLSGSSDRYLKLWEVSSGKEMATMVSSSDDEWVVLTPEGYYNASENGADLLNVRIGNKVYSMDNFFETYYRPDIVKAKLAGKDISTMANANADIRKEQSLPPEVSIVSPQPGQTASSQQATVRVDVTDQGGGIDEVRLYHNGKLVQTTSRGLKLSGQNTREFQVQLVPGKNEFEATAFNDDRIESRRHQVIVNYEGTAPTSDLYVLAVGINEYKNNSLNLNYGRPDAEAFTEAVRRQSKEIFGNIHITTLYDEEATRSNLQSSMEKIIAQSDPEDAFLLFYAGHGVMSEPEGLQNDFYMALHETIQLYGNNDGLQKTGISASEMTELTRRIAARKQMIVLDACQSGGAVETFAMRGAAEQKAIIQLARSAGLVVMASTGTEQYATEFDALGHGVFTYALLNGLEGKADGGSKDGKITVKELEAFINDRVPELTEKHRGQSQYPNSYARGQDFPIGVIKK